MRAAAGLAGRWRRPVIASAPRQACSGSATPSVKVAEVTTTPCAGCTTSVAKGMPGSIQFRFTPTSNSNPSIRSSASHSTVSSRGGAPRSRNSRLQAATCSSPRRSRVRIVGILETRAEQAAKPLQRRCQAFEAVGEHDRRVHQPRDRRPRFSLQPIAIVGEHGPRQYLLPDQHKKLFEALVSASFGDALRPVVAGEYPRRAEDVYQRLDAVV